MNRILLKLLIIIHPIFCYSQNCSYNGTWNGSNCECDPGWTGPDCSKLKILPANPNGGYQPSNIDSWGASILKDDLGVYHMWVSIIDNNCDIEYWARNSKVIHAISSTPEGPYTFQGDAFPVMAHEVDVKRGPNNNWIAFLTAGVDNNGNLAYSDYGAPCICDPSNQQPESNCNYGASTEPTVICTASSPYGPWSDPIVILKPDSLLDGIDANFSAVVHNDSSLVGLWRTYPSGSQVHWVIASNYLDPSTYIWQEQETSLFPAPYDGFTSEGLEDMYVYYNETRDVYHAIFHDMVALGEAEFYDGLGHAYSTDGTNWTYTGEAANTNVNFTDGTTTYSARARPHFIIEDGSITHLISAEQFDENDWSYTLVEPIDNGCSGVDVFVSGNLQETDLSASGIIESDGTIQAGITVAFQAANTIRLLPGFNASKGSTFSARIAPCGTAFQENNLTNQNLNIISGPTTHHPTYRSSLESQQQNIHPAFHSSIWPNPSIEACTLSLKIPASCSIQITLWSAHGNLVSTPLLKSTFPKGNFQIPIPINHLPEGIYFLSINTSTGYQATHRIGKVGY